MIAKKFAAWLTINRNCNLRCDWCYAKQAGFSGAMSLETVGKSISLLNGLSVRNVMIIGGEPTIHPDFLEIVRMIEQAGFRPMLVTNSLRFKDKGFLQESVEAGLRGISTSIKASNNQHYKECTGVAAFDDVMMAIRNIEEVKSETLFHKISLTICKSLFNCFDEVLGAIAGSGAEIVSFDLERPIILNDEAVFDGFVSPKEMAEFLVSVYSKMEAMGIRFNIKIGIPFCLFPKDYISMLVERGQIISGCQLHRGSGIIIDQNGKILPCNHFCDNPLGNLGEVPTGKDYLEWRRRENVAGFYDVVAGYPDERCKACDQWEYCGGGCRIHWMHKGASEMLPSQGKEVKANDCTGLIEA